MTFLSSCPTVPVAGRCQAFANRRRGGQRLDQARETDELDLRRIEGSSETSVHVMGDRVVFPSGWGSAAILSSLRDAV
jgi:hypothetical protein